MSQPGHTAQIAEALASVSLMSATEHTWFGEPSEPLPRTVLGRMTPEVAREYLVYTLTNRLYADFYCHGRPRPSGPPSPAEDADARWFAAALGEANRGGGPWEDGWTVEGVDGRSIVVSHRELRLWARPEACRPLGGGLPEAGTPVSVHLPNELLNLSPGFYMALGDLPLRDQPLLRIYWNLMPEGATSFISEITRGLNSARVAFRVKVVDHPGRFGRADAGVLYIPRACFADVTPLVRRLRTRLRAHLDAAVPALTKALAPGIGLAEDPGPAHESFGQHRCRLIAEGVVRARDRGEDPLATVLATFAEAGVAPEHPYLDRGSADGYEL